MAGGQVTLSASLHGGPAVVTETIFPSGSFDASLSLLPCRKHYSVATGILSATLASPSAFVTLSGVSPTLAGAVARGTLLYFRTEDSFRLRLTIDDGAGGSYTSETSLRGTLLQEFPDDEALLLVEAQGEGVVEYFVAGT